VPFDWPTPRRIKRAELQGSATPITLTLPPLAPPATAIIRSIDLTMTVRFDDLVQTHRTAENSMSERDADSVLS